MKRQRRPYQGESTPAAWRQDATQILQCALDEIDFHRKLLYRYSRIELLGEVVRSCGFDATDERLAALLSEHRELGEANCPYCGGPIDVSPGSDTL
jgi:hypothetical protein